MEKKLLALFEEFTKELEKFNEEKYAIYDDEEPTLKNFIKWLYWKQQNSK